MSSVLTDEQSALIDLVRRFVREEVDPLEEDMDPDASEVAPAAQERLIAKASATGLRGLDVPEEYGGPGLDLVTQALLSLEISQHRAGIYSPCFHAFGGTGLAQLYSGTADQIERFLIPTLAGRMRGYFALTEPGGGSDPARALRTKAERRGGGWVLTGSKLWISGGATDNYGLFFARTGPGHGDITCFIIESGTPGLVVNRVVHTMRSAHPTTEIFLDAVEVPDENRLGEVGEGLNLAKERLSRQRVPYSAISLGAAFKAQQLSLEWAGVRETFGSKLIDHQGIQWMLVDNEVDLRSGRALILEAAARADAGLPFRAEASIAKMVATEAAFRVVDRCIQIHGALGLSKDLPLERWYRELRVRRIAEGPTEVQRLVVARELSRGLSR